MIKKQKRLSRNISKMNVISKLNIIIMGIVNLRKRSDNNVEIFRISHRIIGSV